MPSFQSLFDFEDRHASGIFYSTSSGTFSSDMNGTIYSARLGTFLCDIYTQTDKLSEEYARLIEWKPKWDTGAPIPQVFSNGHKIYLIYLISEPDPHCDGTYVTMIDNSSETQYPLALVEFDGGDFKFGIANDEVFGDFRFGTKDLKGMRHI